ncbi:MAG: UDP-N-acetylglucosamine 2-epimerase (non-hydrolyzing) [Bacteroidetes bacterium]|nr:UDP-N-acetylglucosamine 2-epimerase (non-hydrolyzing) [Bacteroidota bacterium]MCK5766567.1 UDP-N-acetylglucosamine 2-epimerase (non-hydrolyzing) [Bacteroidales bacterium]
MLKILTIIGARPQIIKAAALSRAIRTDYADRINEIILHTGQHYDDNMSQVFFDEMGIPPPDYNLNVGSGSHGKQTAAMIRGIEEVIEKESPDYLVLYGDTNSTLAGAVAAVKLGIPVAHIEAGLRSFNKSMPEEINRITCDHCSTLLFSPTQAGLENLSREGFSANSTPPYNIDHPGVFHCGDVMYDNALFFSEIAEQQTGILKKLELTGKRFILSTIHRDNNTDIAERLNAIFSSILRIATDYGEAIVLPLHPRTLKMIDRHLDNTLLDGIRSSKNIIMIPPVSFLEMIMLEKHSSMIITDSGGVQKESYFYHKPCIILRPETEWVEIVENGTAVITDADRENILSAYQHFLKNPPASFPPLYGDGRAAWFVCETLLST